MFLRFPDELRLSFPARDLITRLMCDVDERLGSHGVSDIKVGHTGCRTSRWVTRGVGHQGGRDGENGKAGEDSQSNNHRTLPRG